MGPYGPYVQLGGGDNPRRTRLPRDLSWSNVDLQAAVDLLQWPKVLAVILFISFKIATYLKLAPCCNCLQCRK